MAMDFSTPRWLEDPREATFHLRALDAHLLQRSLKAMKEPIRLDSDVYKALQSLTGRVKL